MYKKVNCGRSVAAAAAMSVEVVRGSQRQEEYGENNVRAGYDDNAPVTAADVERIVREVISEMTLFILEDDITQAQTAVKEVMEQTYF